MKKGNSYQKIPSSLQGILWSKDVKEIDAEKDKTYIIHHILSYGNLSQIRWLFRVYSLREIRKIFLRHPKKIYAAPVFYLVKNFLLGLERKTVSPKKYVKTSFFSS